MRLRRLDAYILGQIFWPFLFFVLVFTGVIWLTQSLRIIDTIVNNGQSAMVFLEFTGLLLPMVLSIVLQVALFAATLFAMNRMFADSEIVVMFASGQSGMALTRAVLLLGFGVMLVSYALTLYLMPTAQREMRDRISEIRGDVAAAFLRDGTFLNPSKGLTVYVREIGRPGELLGVFIHDRRSHDEIVTYTAERALLVRDPEGTRLVMFDGIAQGLNDDNTALSVLQYEKLTYDLSSLSSRNGGIRARKPSELYLPRLLSITEREARPRSIGDFRAEAHEALSAPLYVLALPLIGVAMISRSGFRRQGILGRIALAVSAAVALRICGLLLKSATSSEAALWPLLYAPPVIGIVGAIWLLGGNNIAAWTRPPRLSALADPDPGSEPGPVRSRTAPTAAE